MQQAYHILRKKARGCGKFFYDNVCLHFDGALPRDQGPLTRRPGRAKLAKRGARAGRTLPLPVEPEPSPWLAIAGELWRRGQALRFVVSSWRRRFSPYRVFSTSPDIPPWIGGRCLTFPGYPHGRPSSRPVRSDSPVYEL